MRFGTRKGDAPESSGNYLRNFGKGETLVRFLEEVDDWLLFFEHYNTEGRSFPCARNEGDPKDVCPGCSHPDEKVSDRKRKYATQVWLVKKDVVLPYRIPVTLADRMSTRSERNGGTIRSRDFVVLKSGSGFDTEYDVDQEDKYAVDLDDLRKKIKIDIQDALKDSFAENAPQDGQTSVSRSKAEKAASNAEPEQKLDDAGDPPSKPQDQQDSGAGERELTEAEVRDMSKKELLALAEKAGLDVDENDTRGEIADKLIAAFGD